MNIRKFFKAIVWVVTILLLLYIIAVSEIDTLIGIVGGVLIAIIVPPIIMGKFEVVSKPSKEKKETRKQKTVVTHPTSWWVDKTYVPGVGYRDDDGNYYDYNGIPKPSTVITKEKK